MVIAIVMAGFCSCNSGSSNNNDNSSASTDSTANTPGVQNANGNMPDTTNSITIEKHSKDTATKH